MNQSFRTIVEDDIPDLARVMKRAFDDDARKHLGVDEGGPPGYDNGDFFRQWLFGFDASVGFAILTDGEIAGGFIVWIHEHGDNTLGTIFVDPDRQDQGVGRRAWEFIEATFPDTRSWSLGTPRWATKNHHFYEVTCGFERVGETDDGLVYRKVVA